MRAYFNGHTIHRHRYHGDCWYTVDDEPQQFASNARAVEWIKERFGARRCYRSTATERQRRPNRLLVV